MAIRYGVARGVFSNEAGLGSAPIAAAAAKTDYPGRQALVSMTGTFLDTIIVCTVTGLAITMSGIYTTHGDAASLTGAAFEFFLPGFGNFIVVFGIIFFLLIRRLSAGLIMERSASGTYSETIGL